ncbi:unnamed protein product [Schistosoma margrebowiei]|uniref:Uncharacterized protein n=1 Tax=Schistosoma margrebowiei TaxID=48269 RepID=A0A3P8I3N2_9TREM|nr:unnamed protein product [Schistosoma margrebowiei]
MSVGKRLADSVQDVNRLNSPITKASKSIQCSIDKPTTNSVEIHCDILSVIKNDDFSFVHDENSKLIAQFAIHNKLSSIDGEYVPIEGDVVEYRKMLIPPKNEKYQAVHVRIVNLSSEKHKTWDEPA